MKDLGKDIEKDLIKLLSKNEIKILELIFNNPKISSRELSGFININERNIRKNMEKLKTKGIIKRIGPDKGSYWEVISK
ncbi:MAG: winged helix-turn-helix transcriptional regulator [Chlorobi bacterium]|nr:winged helix-turn-helix transcriptional regulator [Chlorobiota bacterium]